MENTKKLTGKDLINVGIYTAMTLVISLLSDYSLLCRWYTRFCS